MENNPTPPTPQPTPTPQSAPVQPVPPQPAPMASPAPAPKPKNSPIKKILMIIGAVVVGIIALAIIIIVIVSATSQHMKCTSSYGDIDIMYNDTRVTGYASSGGISYDLDYQQTYSERVGINNYLDEFKTWFQTNTGGTCTR